MKFSLGDEAPIYDFQADQLGVNFVAGLVAMSTGVPQKEIVASRRTSNAASKARHLAMYLVYVGLGWPMTRIAHAFQRDRATAAYACTRVEQERDDPAANERIGELETCVRHAPERGGWA